MPGMDGPSWVREALKVRPDVRVVFVSGYTEGQPCRSDSEPEIAQFRPSCPSRFSLNQLTEAVFPTTELNILTGRSSGNGIVRRQILRRLLRNFCRVSTECVSCQTPSMVIH